jgi:hypothetical protein
VNKNPKRENLKSFKKGQSGNPNGRPKKIPELNKLLSEIDEQDYQAVINKLVAKAKAGDTRAAEVILERAFGKAKDNEGKPTQMIINVLRNS